MFYQFHQNNSGGRNDIDLDIGLGKLLIIEADSDKDANERAIDIGIYFDGVDNEIDCACCGNRWDRADSFTKGDAEPLLYDSPLNKLTESHRWLFPIVVHMKDGRKIVAQEDYLDKDENLLANE